MWKLHETRVTKGCSVMGALAVWWESELASRQLVRRTTGIETLSPDLELAGLQLLAWIKHWNQNGSQ